MFVLSTGLSFKLLIPYVCNVHCLEFSISSQLKHVTPNIHCTTGVDKIIVTCTFLTSVHILLLLDHPIHDEGE